VPRRDLVGGTGRWLADDGHRRLPVTADTAIPEEYLSDYIE
jgi:hypothetical protein